MTWSYASIDTAKLATVSALSTWTIVASPELRPWLIIATGLLVGLMARWAVMQSTLQKLGWREVRIDALVLLMNGLLAAQFAEVFSLSGVKLAVAAAMFGASSTMVFSALHTRFRKQIEQSPVDLFMGTAATTTLPPTQMPITIHTVNEEAVPPYGLPANMQRLLEQLDDAKRQDEEGMDGI